MLSIFPLFTFLTSALFLCLFLSPSLALEKNDDPIIDERYLFLQSLPKERLNVWLDTYQLYKRDKKARKSVSFSINANQLQNGRSLQSSRSHKVNFDQLEWRGELPDAKIYLIGTDKPFTGISHSYRPNGTKVSQTTWKDGKRHGLHMSWYPNGIKSMEGFYLYDKRVRLWIYWYDNGKELYEKHYKNGKLDGSSITWHPNGQMKYEGSWKNGMWHGVSKGWHKDGQKLSVGTWENNKFISGSAKYWNQNGERVDSYNEAVKDN